MSAHDQNPDWGPWIARERVWSRRSVLGALGGLAAASAAVPGIAQEKDGPEPPAEARAITVTASPITSFHRLGSGKRFGKLEFRRGLVLKSEEKAFGGWSGLVVEPDGRRLLAVSDEGAWLTAALTYENGLPAGLEHARIGPIRGQGNRALNRKRDLDAESVALAEGDLDRGTILIGFERNHRIGRFPVVKGAVQPPVGYVKLPPEAKRMRSNRGLEAVTVMAGGPYKGSIVAFSEKFPDSPEQHTGWIWIRGEPQRIGFPEIGGFEVTDAASLADGTLLVLERRFRWTEGVKMRIRRFAPAAVKPGALLEGETLIEADLAYEIDNMEGMAVHRAPSGETILTLISDDNFNTFLQRTILLQFTLLDANTSQTHRT